MAHTAPMIDPAVTSTNRPRVKLSPSSPSQIDSWPADARASGERRRPLLAVPSHRLKVATAAPVVSRNAHPFSTPRPDSRMVPPTPEVGMAMLWAGTTSGVLGELGAEDELAGVGQADQLGADHPGVGLFQEHDVGPGRGMGGDDDPHLAVGGDHLADLDG